MEGEWEEEEEGSVVSPEALIETLTSRGWSFGDLSQVKALIVIRSALLAEDCTADAIESELANLDLRAVGGKSLPDRASFRKLSHVQGPKVLQISSARDVSRSSAAQESGSSSGHRLLRLGLTDGHTEITAVEYRHIPSLPDDVVPGTKVRLENKALVQSGIVCLNPKVVTVIGGVVQTLYEEWEMNKKYAGFSRSTLRPSGDNDVSGPPPFVKLQIEARVRRLGQQGRLPCHSESNCYSPGPSNVKMCGKPEFRQVESSQNLDIKPYSLQNNARNTSQNEKTNEMPSSSETRTKEVAEAVPVQNQAASQKLLQKMSYANRDGQHFKGRKHRGKAKQEESPVYTLNEWNESKGRMKPHMTRTDVFADASHDEELAWQLQKQFDLEDLDVKVPSETEAERVKRSIFNYKSDDNRFHDHEKGYGGRGRRGRGRGRGRGRLG